MADLTLHELAAAPSQPLDLSGLGDTATIQPGDLAHALWVLGTPQPPSKIILPGSQRIRRRLARAGLVFAADRRSIPLEIDRETVSVPEALGIAAMRQPFALEHYDFETSDRMRVVSKLESRLRRPPPAEPDGRRYHWIDGLHVANGHPERERFGRHADQCFFELVDNVHRWARASQAMAFVSATAGGGELSHNRLQVVVVDNGMGIFTSAKAKAEAMIARRRSVNCLTTRGTPSADAALAVMTNLVESVYEKREVCGAQDGHGLFTISRYVSRWNGTINLISSFGPGRAMHIGRQGQSREWASAEYAAEGIRGTIAHLTLDAVRSEVTPSARMRHGALASV